MSRVLVDRRGRRLVLADGVFTDDNVLVVQGVPLIQLEEADEHGLLPSLLEAIAAVVPGASIEPGGTDAKPLQERPRIEATLRG